MAKRYYLPYKKDDIKSWAANYILRLKQVGEELGISPAEIAQTEQLVEQYIQAYEDAHIKKVDASTAVAVRNEKERAMFDAVQPQVQRMKTHPVYKTTGYGELLNIVGVEQRINYDTLKPVLKIVLHAGRPRIIWKKGLAEAINIYVDRKDGKGMGFLTTDMNPDYIDMHPVPEDKDAVVWHYRAIYVINDKEVGSFSEKYSITVTKEL